MDKNEIANSIKEAVEDMRVVLRHAKGLEIEDIIVIREILNRLHRLWVEINGMTEK